MKGYVHWLVLMFALTALCLTPGCIRKDPALLMDDSTPIPDQHWTYLNKVAFDVTIDDPKTAYNLYLNLRVTPDYKYSNIFILVHQTLKGKSIKNTRYEFTLAKPDGEWLGTGTGNLFSFQLLFGRPYKFPGKGTYHFELEQNMRDNPLNDVSDVGMMVEKAE